MGKNGFLGEAIEIMQEEAEKGLTTAKQQISGKQGSQPIRQAQGKQAGAQQTAQSPSDAASKPQVSETLDAAGQATKEFLKDIYSADSPPLSPGEIKQKELEDKQKQEDLRQRLHSQYYQKFINPPKKQEPRAAEKVEQEKQEEMAKLEEEEEKKPKDLPALAGKGKGTMETNRGVSG